MVTEEQMKAALQTYIDAWSIPDAEAIVALFAEDAVVEDPYGTPPHEGRAAIRKFFENAVASGARLTLDGPIRGSHGDMAAMAFTVNVGDIVIRAIDVMRFNDDGLVVHMQALWGPSDMSRSAPTPH